MESKMEEADKHHIHRAESPTPSCVSMKSDKSMGQHPNFSGEPGPPHTKSHRAESPTPSLLSMKSNKSKGKPPTFSDQTGPPHTQSHRAESPTPSLLSMKSDKSKGKPPTFSDQSGPPHTQSHRAESPTPSLLSMKSEKSKGKPPLFSVEPGPPHTQERKRSGCVVTEQASKRSRTTPGLKTPSHTTPGQSVSPQGDLKDYKVSLESLDEVKDHMTEESGTSLTSTYTELYISQGESEGVNRQHEVIQLETASNMKTFHDEPINCCDIFKPRPGRKAPIRRVLTKGIAGIGKTFSVRKFILDWARGLENQDIDLLIPFSFRELNLVRDEQYSLLTLIHEFHPTLKKVTAEQLAAWKVGFIFDGLDESRSSFHFKNKIVSDVTVTLSVDALLTNLIEGNLLPSALLWITTRPAAANQIPPEYIDLVTEVRGFTDPQKEKYFRNRFSDEEQTSPDPQKEESLKKSEEKLADRILSHLKTLRTLYIMCHIPLFCWIIVTVLLDMLMTHTIGQLPKTLTEMCCRFLLVQTKRKKKKYGETDEVNQQHLTKTDRDVLLKLGKLAFEHLEKGSIMFYQEDLEECGLDVKEASLYSGVCTKIFKRESVLFQKTVYSFVHLIIQEFLAAVYLFHCFTQKNMKVLKTFLEDNKYKSDSSLSDFLKAAEKKSLKSKNGHLDLLVRFLHGLSLESNQSLLGGLLDQTELSPEEIQKAIKNLKRMNSHDSSPDRCINIFHCLMEMNDHSLHQEIQKYLKDGSKKKLTGSQCSALAFMLQMSEDVLEEFDLKKYNASEQFRNRLIPAVRNCRKARLVGCDLRQTEVEVVASVLSSNPSHLRELDLSENNLHDSGLLELLCEGLKSLYCRLEILRLVGCNLKQTEVEVVASALSSNPSHLRELDLSQNNLNDSGLLELLCEGLKSPYCILETLRLTNCTLSERCCELLASALRSNLHLKELDVRFNILNESDLKTLISAGQEETVEVKHGGEDWLIFQHIKGYFHRLILDTNTAHRQLSLSENNRKVTCDWRQDQPYPEDPDRFDGCSQVLCTEGLTGRSYWEVECSGQVGIAVTYRGISRKGNVADSYFGCTNMAWRLDCDSRDGSSYSVLHNNKKTVLPVRVSWGSNRVAVYVDCPAGTLSFYTVSSDSLTHLYTFHNTFTEPLYAGFWLWAYSSASVCLCEQR